MYDERTARAQATYDPMRNGVSIIVAPNRDSLVHWGEAQVVRHGDSEMAMEPPSEAYLRVPEDVARAMYEALGRYFGGDATDARRLRLLNVATGAWLIAAPWLLGGGLGAATWNDVAVGIALIALSLPRGTVREHYGGWTRYIC